MSQRPPRPFAFARAYTVIELMMALGALAVGVSGVIAMQKVTLASNQSAKQMSVGTRVAEAWADQLTADGSTWTLSSTGSTLGQTDWLRAALPNDTTNWFLPPYVAARDFGPGFTALGAPIDHTVLPAEVHYCVHLRLAYLHSETTPTTGNGVIRAQIRVFWPREGATNPLATTVLADLCSLAPAQFDANLGALHVIYLSSAIREAPGLP